MLCLFVVVVDDFFVCLFGFFFFGLSAHFQFSAARNLATLLPPMQPQLFYTFHCKNPEQKAQWVALVKRALVEFWVNENGTRPDGSETMDSTISGVCKCVCVCMFVFMRVFVCLCACCVSMCSSLFVLYVFVVNKIKENFLSSIGINIDIVFSPTVDSLGRKQSTGTLQREKTRAIAAQKNNLLESMQGKKKPAAPRKSK